MSLFFLSLRVSPVRSAGKAAKLVMECSRLAATDEQCASAARKVRRVPPRALRGRWGSASNCETFFLEIGKHVLRKIWPVTVGTRRTRRAGPVGLQLGDVDEDEEDYGDKVCRYAQEVNNEFQSDRFWHLAYIANKSRQPLMHLQHRIQESNGSRTLTMLMLVCQWARDCSVEYDRFLSSDSVQTVWAPVLEVTEVTDAAGEAQQSAEVSRVQEGC